MQQLNTANRRAIQRAASNNLRRQGGWSLIEIGAVIAIVIFLVVVNYPSIKGYFIQGRVPAAAGELQRFMSTARIMGEGDTATPYASINNAQNLAPSMRDSTVFKVTGSTVAHRLGGRGVGSNGTITIAPAALGGGASGSALSLTVTNVNHRACPVLASIMNGVSEMISVNGTVAKTLGANNESGSFNAVTAQDLCVNGDNNTFVFATR
ncbi:prepilin-type cleavage/methylation domain-containing protein [Achromobacter sp. SD115]|jgi:type II secretory pathway pseudopilin PulG|uniref:pilus assembly FimT family protein n=1 Tax=Achromobacter TaxID=222 RepID=UPI001A96BFDE|nr:MULTISPECIES: prepilin-type cleavage/methylation domain-containing protein [Achromobacter]MBO1014958.1 prepilin-type cleavage/methylation domain-containing protein [Achromobacter sp. SD115]